MILPPDKGDGEILQLSVIIPLYNEAENVKPLLDELFEVLKNLGKSFEVVAVDDGSSDETFLRLSAYASEETYLRVIRFRRNFGQTAAMSAGIESALGQIIIPMDGDLQNDPADIPKLLEKLEGVTAQGTAYDVVSGWRQNRKDREFGRRLPSQLANALISAISGVHLHDYGCSLKVYRREVLEGVKLYGEMHRFIPIYASWQGARVTEQVVNHRPRHAGHSKYGLGRTGKVILDLMVVKFLASFTTKPIYVFGGIGLTAFLLGMVAFLISIVLKVFSVRDFVQTPLPLLGTLFCLAGIFGILMGLLAELMVRTYYESQGKRPFLVAEELNAPAAKASWRG